MHTYIHTHTYIMIHKLLSYQVRRNYLPFQYFTSASVDVLLLMSALVLNICTKIHLIYLIIVSCPLRNVLIASLRERERERMAGEGTTTMKTCNLDFKAKRTGQKSHPPIAVSFSLPSVVFAFFVHGRKDVKFFDLIQYLKSLNCRTVFCLPDCQNISQRRNNFAPFILNT